MIYLSQILGNPVMDVDGERLGTINDLGIATGEVFPRITSVAFRDRGHDPLMISWGKYVGSYNEHEVRLKVKAVDIRFSYLQPDEVLLARDILNKQIVDTHGMRVVRVNDLKLSDTSSTQLRLLGAEVGVRGILRTLSPGLERVALKMGQAFGHPIAERIIAWSYMDLVERDLSNVKLSVSHKTLDELHPADIADIIEQLDPRLRGQVFAQLDDEQRAGAIAELEGIDAAELVGGMSEQEASRLLQEMDPDDAAELVGELDYERAEKLLKLMGVKEERAIRQLLGYPDDTAGRIMTQEVVLLPETAHVSDAVDKMRSLDEDFETVRYIYVADDENKLTGVVSLDRLIISEPEDVLGDIATRELVSASPEEDQEDVANDIAKYNLLAMPVVDEDGHLLGVVTVDDALDVMEDEHEEDLQIAGAGRSSGDGADELPLRDLRWALRRELWFVFWMAGVGVLWALLMQLWGSSFALADALLMAAALPVTLIVADDSVDYVTNFYLEHDPDDENSPSFLGFGIKSLGIGVVLAILVMALAAAVISVVSFGTTIGELTSALMAGFIAASVSVLISYALSGVGLAILRSRDAHNKETSGVALSAVSMAVALIAFILVVLAVATQSLV
ncbi:MAG: magnesium transporter [Atopobiaceae bacterium]|jgi:magnesium transporter